MAVSYTPAKVHIFREACKQFCKYVNGTLTINQFNSDVNGDGVIDIADAVMIVNYIVGKLGTQSRE